MKIVYSLSIEDYVAISHVNSKISPQFKKNFRIMRFMTASAFTFFYFIFILALKGKCELCGSDEFLALIIFLFVFIAFPFYERKDRIKQVRSFYKRKFKSKDSVEITIELGEERLKIIEPDSDESFSLKFISDIMRTPTHLILTMEMRTRLFLPIAKTPEDLLDNFIAELRTRIPQTPFISLGK